MHRYSRSILTNPSGKIVCVMVGLPARGKTYIARKLSRYLNWLGIQTQVFNVGDYRRQISGAVRPHAFFDPANTEAEAERHRAAEAALIDLCKWLEGTDGEVAVFDATNTNRMRREWVKKTCDAYGFSVILFGLHV
jgi:6-phosphofructo-2-kinase/fructose-2,6-biphosphatase 2